jgi:NADH-quinone oxidoreductase subunit N
VASKAAGFVALINVVFFCFAVRPDIVQPLFFVLSAATMTVGNLIALKQTNVVRMLAYSGIAQAGFILAPFVVVDGARQQALSAIVVYLVIYAAMTLGAFGVVIAVVETPAVADVPGLAGIPIGVLTAIAFLVGAGCSMLSGIIGMTISVRSNVRTASAARRSCSRWRSIRVT